MREQAKPLQSQLGSVRRGVSNAIFALLLREITSGQLPAGSRLPPERELAEHFGVSQPTVREAIRGLDTMGLVQVRHGSGAYVTGESSTLLHMALLTLLQLESVSILDLLEVRSVLGSYSARRGAANATKEDVEHARALSDQLASGKELATVEGIAQAVVDFQIAVSHAAHNPLIEALEGFIIRLMMDLQLAARPRTVTSWRRFTGGFSANRSDLVEALARQDEDAAVKAMTAYLDHQHEAFIRDSELSKARLSQAGSLRVLSQTLA